jgi:heat shock protein HtpX
MLPAFGLYTHIRSNKYRSAFLLGGLFFLVYLLTYAGALAAEGFWNSHWRLQSLMIKAFDDLIMAFPYVTGATLLWVAFAYKFNQRLIALAVGGHAITREEYPKLYDMLENLCISRGMTMPRFEIMETDTPNAFASGVNDKQYTITLTRGLINMLSDDEMEAVIAHELTHIRNGDVRMMIFAMIIAGVIAFFAELLFRWLLNSRSARSSSRNSDSKGGGGMAIMIAVAIVAVAWFLSIVIRFSLSRSREYLADAGAVELTKNPDAMISALRKIEGKGELQEAPSAVMEMCIENPRSGFADLFSTHPTVDSRVDALVRYAGGHDLDPAALEALRAPQVEGADGPPPDHIDQAGQPEQQTATLPQPDGVVLPRAQSRRLRMPWGPPR